MVTLKTPKTRIFLCQTCVEGYARAFGSLWVGVWAEFLCVSAIRNGELGDQLDFSIQKVPCREFFNADYITDQGAIKFQGPFEHAKVLLLRSHIYVHCKEMIRGSRDTLLIHCNPCRYMETSNSKVTALRVPSLRLSIGLSFDPFWPCGDILNLMLTSTIMP